MAKRRKKTRTYYFTDRKTGLVYTEAQLQRAFKRAVRWARNQIIAAFDCKD